MGDCKTDRIEVLLLDDAPESDEMVRHFNGLLSAGYKVHVVKDGKSARAALARPFRAAILDVNLMCGWEIERQKELLESIGEDPHVPEEGEGFQIAAFARHIWPDMAIIMLTSERLSDDDIIAGLGCGADDYISKYVQTSVFCAKLDAVLRRSQRCELPIVKVGELHLNLRGKLLFSDDDQSVLLTPAETRLLERLSLAGGRAISRDTLVAWALPLREQHSAPSDDARLRAVDTLLSKLRRKVRGKLGHELPIETVYGQGYRMA